MSKFKGALTFTETSCLFRRPEGQTNRIMYEAELVAGEGRLNKQDISVKVSAPLNIDISCWSFSDTYT